MSALTFLILQQDSPQLGVLKTFGLVKKDTLRCRLISVSDPHYLQVEVETQQDTLAQVYLPHDSVLMILQAEGDTFPGFAQRQQPDSH